MGVDTIQVTYYISAMNRDESDECSGDGLRGVVMGYALNPVEKVEIEVMRRPHGCVAGTGNASECFDNTGAVSN